MSTSRVETYPIPPVQPRDAPPYLESHLEKRVASYRSASEDVKYPVTFAVIFTMNALQPVLFDMARDETNKRPRTLASGWTCERLDLGNPWHKDFVFSSPHDPEEGFVLRATLDLVETPAVETKPFDMATFLSEFKATFEEEERFLTTGETSPRYLPENSDNVQEVSAYAFSKKRDWHRSSRTALVKTLASGAYASEAFTYRPDKAPYLDNNWRAYGLSRGVTPDETLAALPVVVEALRDFDGERCSLLLAEHGLVAYETLQQEERDILMATRGAMAMDGHLPGEGFLQLIDHLWKVTFPRDVAGRLEYVDQVAERLLELGHVSKKTEYDCNDGRTRVYATYDGETATVHVERDNGGVAYARRNDRTLVSRSGYRTGAIGETMLDFAVDDDGAILLTELGPFDGDVSGIVSRGLLDIESVHCCLDLHLARHVAQAETEAPAP